MTTRELIIRIIEDAGGELVSEANTVYADLADAVLAVRPDLSRNAVQTTAKRMVRAGVLRAVSVNARRVRSLALVGRPEQPAELDVDQLAAALLRRVIERAEVDADALAQAREDAEAALELAQARELDVAHLRQVIQSRDEEIRELKDTVADVQQRLRVAENNAEVWRRKALEADAALKKRPREGAGHGQRVQDMLSGQELEALERLAREVPRGPRGR